MDNYVGEIRLFSGNFAPRGWALCNGQLLAIAQNQALFSILGTTYGGDGRTTFGLPDFRGRIPMNWGTSAQGTYALGEKAGTENVTLLTNQIPQHNHIVSAVNTIGTVGDPTNAFLGISIDSSLNGAPIYAPTANTVMSPASIGMTGGTTPHENRQPLLAITFIVALQGVFPSRN